jgi:hypothetical protein
MNDKSVIMKRPTHKNEPLSLEATIILLALKVPELDTVLTMDEWKKGANDLVWADMAYYSAKGLTFYEDVIQEYSLSLQS